jgi:hypothetical protein
MCLQAHIMQYMKPFFNLLEIWIKVQLHHAIHTCTLAMPCTHQNRKFRGHSLSLWIDFAAKKKPAKQEAMPTCLNFGTKGHFHSILPYHALYYPTEFWEVIFCHWKLLAASIKPEFIHALTQKNKKNTSFYAFPKQ